MAIDLIGKWYTDLVDVYRDTDYKDGSVTKQMRLKVLSKVPCRVFRSARARPDMTDTAAEVVSSDALACANEVDIKAGDLLMITRGGRIGKQMKPPDRYFAGSTTYYYEPFGGVMPKLDHQEIPLLLEERIAE